MKKAVYILALFVLIFSTYSCEKEVIEIVNRDADNTEITTKSFSCGEDSDDDLGEDDTVTDPDEDEDFDLDRKNNGQ